MATQLGPFCGVKSSPHWILINFVVSLRIFLAWDVRVSRGRPRLTTIPTLGSFKSGHAEWKILGMEERTQVIYQAQMEPDVYIPPLIGNYFVKRKLRKSILASLAKIECIARIQAAQERNHALDPVLVADEAADDHAVDAALLAGQDPTLVTRAPAAGSTVREQTDCVQSCGINDATC